ncbi:histidine--tRNA ligase, partial [bacterium]|nr:histidine--tRNA ligase [bacterium]
IELLVGFLKSCGLSNFETQLNTVGCKEDRARYSAALQEILRPKKNQMCEDCQDRIERNPLRVLDCKVEADQPMINALPAIDDYLCEGCRQHFEAVQKYLRLASIDTVRNKRLVRGLDYYTKTTFEIVAGGLGAQNSVAGGGRYDGLVEELGGKPTKAIGFALGLDRLILALPDTIGEMEGIRVFIVAMDDAAFDYAYEHIQAPLRKAGIPSEVDYQRRSLKGAMRQADKKKVDWVIIAGDQERQENKATLKNMKTGEQGTYSIDEVIEKVR